MCICTSIWADMCQPNVYLFLQVDVPLDYSLRQYVSVLYKVPRMQVKTCYWMLSVQTCLPVISAPLLKACACDRPSACS